MIEVGRAREAWPGWRDRTVRDRLRVLKAARHRIAASAGAIAELVPRASRAETLSAELLPLADSVRFLERNAPKLLRPVRHGFRGRPAWLVGSRLEVRREPIGVVLVLGPGNYPLMLPGVQSFQALAAGNAVLWKPGTGGGPAASRIAKILTEVGLPDGVLAVLPEDPEAGLGAIRAGVDKVALTGSTETGKAVLERLAPTVTPAVMELAGCDPVFVRSDADLGLVARALRFGLTFNGSATCVAPRRVYVADRLAAGLEERLGRLLAGEPPVPVGARSAERMTAAIERALARGARLVTGGAPVEGSALPTVIAAARPEIGLGEDDLFAPLIAIYPVRDDDHALEWAARSRYALGASVFGKEPGALRLASRVRAGTVTVNDVIVPTADPRAPFGGRGASGFGVTRGAEGLLEWTVPKAVLVRRGRSRRHLDPLGGGEDRMFEAWIRAAHGGSWSVRGAGWAELIRAGRSVTRARRGS